MAKSTAKKNKKMFLKEHLKVISFTSLCKESVKTEHFDKNRCALLKGLFLL